MLIKQEQGTIIQFIFIPLFRPPIFTRYEVRILPPPPPPPPRVSLIKWFIGPAKYSNFCIQLGTGRLRAMSRKPRLHTVDRGLREEMQDD